MVKLDVDGGPGFANSLQLGQIVPVLGGALAGLLVTYGSARVVGSLLFGVSAHDTAITAGAFSVLVAIGALACLLPARGAASVDPMQALRRE